MRRIIYKKDGILIIKSIILVNNFYMYKHFFYYLYFINRLSDAIIQTAEELKNNDGDSYKDLTKDKLKKLPQKI